MDNSRSFHFHALYAAFCLEDFEMKFIIVLEIGKVNNFLQNERRENKNTRLLYL